MSERIEVKIDVFDDLAQRAQLLRSITVGELIEEIIVEFGLSRSAGDGDSYVVTLKHNQSQLEPGQSLAQQRVQDGDGLVFGWKGRKPITGTQTAHLREEVTGDTYPIRWQPAIIGRPGGGANEGARLAVNLEWLPNGRRVSRIHAQITESRGRYYLEHLSGQNLTILNDEQLGENDPRELQHGDRIYLSRNRIALIFELVN